MIALSKIKAGEEITVAYDCSRTMSHSCQDDPSYKQNSTGQILHYFLAFKFFYLQIENTQNLHSLKTRKNKPERGFGPKPEIGILQTLEFRIQMTGEFFKSFDQNSCQKCRIHFSPLSENVSNFAVQIEQILPYSSSNSSGLNMFHKVVQVC